MKLNLELEIDWIDEEMGIDDVVKTEVINSIVSKIQNKVLEQTEKKVNNILSENVENKINELTNDLFIDFMSKPVTINDNYGSEIKTYDNVEAVIKERFDKFMTQTVDKNGKLETGRYSSGSTRIAYIIDNQLKEFADKFTTDAVKKVSEEIKEHVKNGLTNKLGKELMTVLKVDKMIGLPES